MSTEVANNEFFNFLDSQVSYNVLIRTERNLGLKQAKDIVDLIASGIHELKP